jgi:hypothetical protein
MSLDYTLTKIADFETICFEHDANGERTGLNPVTHTLVWSTMIVGMGSITEQNAGKFYGRLYIYQKLFGGLMQRAKVDGDKVVGVEEVWLTPAHVRLHIGLYTNVFPTEPDAKWRRRMAESAERDAARVFGGGVG